MTSELLASLVSDLKDQNRGKLWIPDGTFQNGVTGITPHMLGANQRGFIYVMDSIASTRKRGPYTEYKQGSPLANQTSRLVTSMTQTPETLQVQQAGVEYMQSLIKTRSLASIQNPQGQPVIANVQLHNESLLYEMSR